MLSLTMNRTVTWMVTSRWTSSALHGSGGPTIPPSSGQRGRGRGAGLAGFAQGKPRTTAEWTDQGIHFKDVDRINQPVSYSLQSRQRPQPNSSTLDGNNSLQNWSATVYEHPAAAGSPPYQGLVLRAPFLTCMRMRALEAHTAHRACALLLAQALNPNPLQAVASRNEVCHHFAEQQCLPLAASSNLHPVHLGR